jgi:hypothetical protein
MRNKKRALHVAGPAAIVAAALFAFTVNFQPSPVGGSVEVGFIAKAQAFDPVGYVWEKFRKGVLEKVADFIRKPIEAAKKGLQSLIDKALASLKNLFMEKVLVPALQWALEKIFPGAEKFMSYVEQALGKVESLMNAAEKYAEAVDAIILKNAQKFESVIGQVDSSLDVIHKFNVQMVVDIALAIAKEKADAFIKAKTIELLNKAYSLVETPIEMGKAAACSAIGSIPIVGGLLRGAADFIITQGLKLLRTKGFEFVADEAVELANKAIDWVGAKLKGVAAKVDVAIGPVLDKIKGFIDKAVSVVAPVKEAFSKVKAGLLKAKDVMASLKAGAQKIVGAGGSGPTMQQQPAQTPAPRLRRTRMK